MFRDTSGLGRTCSRCGGELKQLSCFNCSGEGETRVLLFFKKTCETCGGTGVVWRCPDALKANHIQPISLTGLSKRGSFQNPIKTATPVLKQKQPQGPPVPPPWDSRNPNVLNPMHPRSPYNPNNPNSPLNPSNPRNPNNPMNPNSPMNPRNKPFKK